MFDHNWLNLRKKIFVQKKNNLKQKQNIYHLCLVFAYVCVCFTLHLDVIYLITQQFKYQVDIFHRKMICICTGFLSLAKINNKLQTVTNACGCVEQFFFFFNNLRLVILFTVNHSVSMRLKYCFTEEEKKSWLKHHTVDILLLHPSIALQTSHHLHHNPKCNEINS